jgi:chromosomal replication initiator protein
MSFTPGETIIREASRVFGVRRSDIVGACREDHVCRARFGAMWSIRKGLRYSLNRTGRLFGNRDHTTVLHAERRAEAMRDENESFRKATDDLMGLAKDRWA